MSKAFERFGISEDELRSMIGDAAEVDAGVNEFMEKEVVPYWRGVSPMLKEGQPGADKREPGAYKASVKVIKKAKRGKGKVGTRKWYAHFIEDGTAHSPEFAPGQKTASHFGGSIERRPGGGKKK